MKDWYFWKLSFELLVLYGTETHVSARYEYVSNTAMFILLDFSTYLDVFIGHIPLSMFEKSVGL